MSQGLRNAHNLSVTKTSERNVKSCLLPEVQTVFCYVIMAMNLLAKWKGKGWYDPCCQRHVIIQIRNFHVYKTTKALRAMDLDHIVTRNNI